MQYNSVPTDLTAAFLSLQPAMLPVTENTEAKLSVGSQGSVGSSRASRRGSAAAAAPGGGGRAKDLMMDSEPT